MKLVVPLKLRIVLFSVNIAPPPTVEPSNGHCPKVALLSKMVVFPVNVRLLLEAPPSTLVPQALFCMNSVTNEILQTQKNPRIALRMQMYQGSSFYANTRA